MKHINKPEVVQEHCDNEWFKCRGKERAGLELETNIKTDIKAALIHYLMCEVKSQKNYHPKVNRAF